MDEERIQQNQKQDPFADTFEKVVPISAALRFGWEIFKSNALFFIGLLILVWAIPMVIGFISEAATGLSDALLVAINLIGAIASVIIAMGVLWIALAFCDEGEPQFTDLATPTKYFFSFVAASILYCLMVFVGTLFFIIPGIYLAVRFWLFRYPIVDRGAGPIEALKEASTLSHGVKWELFVYLLLVGILNFLGALAFFVGLFITIPVTMLASAYIYRLLQTGEKPKAARNAQSIEQQYGLE